MEPINDKFIYLFFIYFVFLFIYFLFCFCFLCCFFFFFCHFFRHNNVFKRKKKHDNSVIYAFDIIVSKSFKNIYECLYLTYQIQEHPNIFPLT